MVNNNKHIGLWAPFRGKVGTEHANIQYARALKKLGFKVTLITLLDEFDEYETEFCVKRIWPSWLNWIGSRNYFFRRDYFLLALLSSQRLRKLLMEEKIDFLISSLCSTVASKAVQNTNIKLIISVQGFPKFLLTKDNLFSKIENIYRKKSWKKYYRHAAKIITMTDYTEDKLSLLFPEFREKLKTIPNPLFSKSENFQNSRNCGKNADNVNVIFVGRYSYQKDFELFYKIAKNFEGSTVFKFEVYGDFPRKIQSEYRSSNLVYMGYVEDFWSIKARSIHLVTSRWEDPGHALLEGLSRNIPTVIVSRDAPHVELGKNFGALVVNELDVCKVLSSYLLNDKNISPPHDNQVERLIHEYSIEHFQKQVAKILGIVHA
jgi:glycosyltransferase involved in cell wall biosynthesis